MAFLNSFFSIAGQKERIANVGAVVNAAFNPFSKTTITANTGNATANKALSTAVSHPYLAALTATAAIAPAATATVAGNVVKSVAGRYAAAPLGTQVTLAGVGYVGANVLSTSSKARAAVINAPSSIAKASQDVGVLIDNPSLSGVGQFIKEHPFTTAGAAAALAIGAAGASNLVATAINTSAVRANTAATAATVSTAVMPSAPSPLPAVIPLTPAAVAAASPVASSPAAAVISPKKKRKSKKKKKKPKKKSKRKSSKRKPKKKTKKRKYKKKKKKKR